MDGNLLSGLGNLGLGNLEGLDIYEDAHEKEKKEAAKVPEVKEEDMVFDKSYECPVCDETFKAKMVRAGKAKAMAADQDLRPRYEGIDVLKYDIISCPHCGYSAMSKTFPYLTAGQKKVIRENISSSFKPRNLDPDRKSYTYEEALERHKLALVNTIVKHGKASEKAYVCLKTGWLLRGQTESFDKNDEDYEKKKRENENAENQFLKNAYDGFITARSSENFPICGMDEMTVDYLLATLAMRFEEYDTASKLVGSILTSKMANSRIKDRAYDLKETLLEKLKGKKGNE